MKIRFNDHLAAEIFVYVDDGWPTGYCTDLTWQAARAYGSGCSRQGIQARCLEEADLAHGVSRTLGRNGHAH
jgi:hypothetical protein